MIICNNTARPYLVGGIPTPLKNMSQLGLLFPIYGKIKNGPNHQLAMVYDMCNELVNGVYKQTSLGGGTLYTYYYIMES